MSVMTVMSILAVRSPVEKMIHEHPGMHSRAAAANIAVEYVFPRRRGITTRTSWISCLTLNCFMMRAELLVHVAS